MYCTCAYVLQINVYDWANVVHNQTKKWDNVRTLGKVNNWFQKYTFHVIFLKWNFLLYFACFILFSLFVAAILFAYLYVMVMADTPKQPCEVETKNIGKQNADKCLLAFIHDLYSFWLLYCANQLHTHTFIYKCWYSYVHRVDNTLFCWHALPERSGNFAPVHNTYTNTYTFKLSFLQTHLFILNLTCVCELCCSCMREKVLSNCYFVLYLL